MGIIVITFQEEINAQIDHLCTLRFTKEELNYLRTIRFIKNDYVEFLRYGARSAMQFEIYLLEIINEVYFRMKYDYEVLRKSAEEKLDA